MRAGFALVIAVALTLGGCVKKRGGARWAARTGPKVHVNQVGYLPAGPKTAILRSSSKAPVEVTLEGPSGTVWRGLSQPFGFDKASGHEVHRIDFSSVREKGAGFRLTSRGETSFPFTISEEIYDRLPFEAAKYFYHNRSGVPLVVPYVPSDLWSRPPGHLSDRSVPCWPGGSCTYRLDVSGGWYDAGDYGKYVVNGGISVWTLLALYERTSLVGGDLRALGDGAWNIPESHNGVPDILDEARFELEFLMKMQVPAGQPLEHMAHHKIHDHSWSALAIEPPTETASRGIHPPSTAATLNLAAVLAQAARLYPPFDAAFAARALDASRKAYAAAKREPTRYASPTDKTGGGPYDDKDVTDEFFWAEVELYLTTGEEEFRSAFENSPHFSAFPIWPALADGSPDRSGVSGSMSWQATAALGWISLGLKEAPDKELKARAREEIIRGAESYLEIEAKEGYGHPLQLGTSGRYPWGSNSVVVNNAIVLALAFDFTRDPRFARGVIGGLDYLLGKNPIHQTYVSGYGTVRFENPHHRFWAHSMNSAFPPPPPGALAGGPNSGLEDPTTRRHGLRRDMPPAQCYLDHIDAYSVNEVAINWNAPLVWVSAFVRERSRGDGI